MIPAALLVWLYDNGVTVVGTTHRPELDGPELVLTEDILSNCRRHRWLFEWLLAGAATGHAWHICNICGEMKLIRPRGSRSCTLTPTCAGRLIPCCGGDGHRDQGDGEVDRMAARARALPA